MIIDVDADFQYVARIGDGVGGNRQRMIIEYFFNESLLGYITSRARGDGQCGCSSKKFIIADKPPKRERMLAVVRQLGAQYVLPDDVGDGMAAGRFRDFADLFSAIHECNKHFTFAEHRGKVIGHVFQDEGFVDIINRHLRRRNVAGYRYQVFIRIQWVLEQGAGARGANRDGAALFVRITITGPEPLKIAFEIGHGRGDRGAQRNKQFTSFWDSQRVFVLVFQHKLGLGEDPGCGGGRVGCTIHGQGVGDAEGNVEVASPVSVIRGDGIGIGIGSYTYEGIILYPLPLPCFRGAWVDHTGCCRHRLSGDGRRLVQRDAGGHLQAGVKPVGFEAGELNSFSRDVFHADLFHPDAVGSIGFRGKVRFTVSVIVRQYFVVRRVAKLYVGNHCVWVFCAERNPGLPFIIGCGIIRCDGNVRVLHACVKPFERVEHGEQIMIFHFRRDYNFNLQIRRRKGQEVIVIVRICQLQGYFSYANRRGRAKREIVGMIGFLLNTHQKL